MAGRLIVYLLDTNIWLERFLEQDRADVVRRFLDAIPPEELFLTDFSFHSIGLILTRLKRFDILLRFVEDIFLEAGVTLIHLPPDDTPQILHVLQSSRLDFDDAYQYVAAEKHNLTLISFDTDFDHTQRGRMTPDALLR